MCVRCDKLEEEVAFLKSELGLQHAADHLHRLCVAFGVSPGPAHVLGHLYAAKRPVMAWQLAEALPGRDDRDFEVARVYVSRLRKVMGRGAIETFHGHGYRLAPGGVDQVNHALNTEIRSAFTVPADGG